MITAETTAERGERERLRHAARLWLPRLERADVDRLVATAWLDALESGERPDTLASTAAAGVRRLARVELAADAPRSAGGERDPEALLARLVLSDADAEPGAERARRPAVRAALRLRVRTTGRRARATAVVALLAAFVLVASLLPRGGGRADPEPVASGNAARAPVATPAPRSAAPAAAGTRDEGRRWAAVRERAARREAERRRQSELRDRARAQRRATARRRAEARRRAAPRRPVVAAAPSPVVSAAPPVARAPAPRSPAPRTPAPPKDAGSWGSEFRP